MINPVLKCLDVRYEQAQQTYCPCRVPFVRTAGCILQPIQKHPQEQDILRHDI